MAKNQKYQYFIVVLSTIGKLYSGYYTAASIADALDIMIEFHSLEGQIADYKYCLRQEKFVKDK